MQQGFATLVPFHGHEARLLSIYVEQLPQISSGIEFASASFVPAEARISAICCFGHLWLITKGRLVPQSALEGFQGFLVGFEHIWVNTPKSFL
jgi:hypothetical protein